MGCLVGAIAASALATGALSAPAASADPPSHGHTLYVSHTGTAGAADESCTTAAYSSIQDAIDAASNGSEVYLCGTTPYLESVAIQDKSLTLTGDPGATIKAPTDAAAPTTFFSSQGLVTPNAIVTVIGNDNVAIGGLAIEGPFDNTGCSPDDFGVLQVQGGHLRLRNDQVLDIAAASPALGGCQYGVGVQIGRDYWPKTTGGFAVVGFVGDAQIQDTMISGYQKNGMTADAPGTTVDVRATTVDGGGQTAQIARNGIQISRGASGQVHNSSINDNEYTGPASFAAATGVLVYGGCGDPLSTGVQVHNNTLHNNDAAVYLTELDPSCSTAPSTATDNQVHNNSITKSDGETDHSPFSDESGNSYTAYQVGIADSSGNGDQIHNNDITGTFVAGTDTAYGPQTTAGGPFLAPIDIQTYPPVGSHVNNNTYDGSRTNPPY